MTVALSETELRVLRDYQTEAVEAVQADWEAGYSRVGVVAPTGVGKSTIIGKLVSDAYREGGRVVLLAHRGELIEQMLRDLRAVDPAIPEEDMGVVMAEQDDHHAPIVAATLQTLASARRRQALGKRTHIFWDEVHHAGAEGFHATFKDLGGYDDALMCGFTATMRRNDHGRVGLGDVIQKISFKRDLRWAIDHEHLVRPKGLTVRIDGLNQLNEVRTVAGDFVQSELAQVMEAATGYVVEAVQRYAANRHPIIFAASVGAAHAIAERLCEVGYPAIAVTGEQSYEQRRTNYEAYRKGWTRALVTVMVLTEGADFPMCDAAVLARPTRSPNLYIQMIGRSLRLYPGKTDALVLDLSGSSRVMRLVSLPQLLPGVESVEVGEDGEELEPQETVTDEEREITRLPKPQRRGAVDMVSIDLISGRESGVLWLETPAGVPFVALADGWIVFLWPQGGDRHATRWAVGNLNTRTRAGGWMGGSEQYRSLDGAIAYAEESIPAAGFALPQRRAAWHVSGQGPSEAQVRLARSLGIPDYADMTKGRLSDEISITFAARHLDPAMRQPDRDGIDIAGQEAS